MFGRFLVKSIAFTANIVVVSLFFLTLLASVISPEKVLLPAYSTLIFPLIVLANIGFVFFWALARKWQFLISLATLIFATPNIAIYSPIHFGKTTNDESGKVIKIMTYNVMLNGMLEKDTGSSPNKVIQFIQKEDADVVCLQEFSVSPKTKYFTEKDVVKAFQQYPYHHITYKYRSNWSMIGLATFSKFPIVNKDSIHFDSDYNLCHYTDINVDGKIIRFVNVHLESNRLTDKDKAMPIELKDDFNTERLTGTTKILSQKLGAAYRVRAIQADSVRTLLNRTRLNTVVCGDFNDIPLSYSYTKVKGNMKDAYAESGFGPGWTYNESIFRFRIDHILIDPQFEVMDCHIAKTSASDHFPVITKIKID